MEPPKREVSIEQRLRDLPKVVRYKIIDFWEKDRVVEAIFGNSDEDRQLYRVSKDVKKVWGSHRIYKTKGDVYYGCRYVVLAGMTESLLAVFCLGAGEEMVLRTIREMRGGEITGVKDTKGVWHNPMAYFSDPLLPLQATKTLLRLAPLPSGAESQAHGCP